MHLDKQHPTPVYLQLKEMLQNQIEQGIYRSHQKLPSERDLCQLYDLSRMTARRALQELVEAGLAYTRVGKGTFVGENNRVKETGQLPGVRLQTGGVSISGSVTEQFQQKLVDRLLFFDCVGVDHLIKEALAAFPVETVAMDLFPPVIRQLEQQWLRGETSLLANNYAVTTLRSHLIAMANAVATPESNRRALLACAPNDQHEIGLLLLYLGLQRRGYQVIYLGPNVASSDFHFVIETAQPQLVCFSASTTEAGQSLTHLSRQCPELLNRSGPPNAAEIVFGFGGTAFIQNRELISQVPGLYLGDTVETAISRIEAVFAHRPV